MKKSYKKVEFSPYDLSEKAYKVYSTSDFAFYKYYDEDCYLMAENSCAFPFEIGTLKDVEEYLLYFAE